MASTGQSKPKIHFLRVKSVLRRWLSWPEQKPITTCHFQVNQPQQQYRIWQWVEAQVPLHVWPELPGDQFQPHPRLCPLRSIKLAPFKSAFLSQPQSQHSNLTLQQPHHKPTFIQKPIFQKAQTKNLPPKIWQILSQTHHHSIFQPAINHVTQNINPPPAPINHHPHSQPLQKHLPRLHRFPVPQRSRPHQTFVRTQPIQLTTVQSARAQT